MENLKLKDFLDYKFLSQLRLSPDGKHAAFVVAKSNEAENKYSFNIWVMNTEDNSIRQLTNNNEERSFLWLDNSTLLFSGNRDKGLKDVIEQGEEWTVYYSININGGEAQEYMRIPASVNRIKPIGDDNFALTIDYNKNKVDIHNLKGTARDEAVAKIKDEKDYEVLDEIPFWANGVGFTNKTRDRLYLYNKSSKKLTPVTDEYTHVETYRYKDGKIVFTAVRFENKMELFSSLNIYDIKENKIEVLIPQDKYSIGSMDLTSEGIILTLTDMKEAGLNQNHDIYLYKDGELKLITYHDTGMYSSVGSDCELGGGEIFKVYNDKLYFVSTIRKSSFLNRLSLNGDLEILTDDIGTVDCFDVCDNKMLFVGMRNYKLQEIYKIVEDKEEQLTHINEEVLKNKTISVPEYMPFFNNDGMELDGFVIKPVGYDENKTYPAIYDIHGGPKTVYGEVFFHEMQVWANLGYFVFFCNPRGGDGRGNEFADIRGKYGTIDYDDLMKFNDMVLQAYPQIDKDRIGVTGGSYGGFMTNWIIGHTNRYKCACSQRSIANWISKFGTTDIGYYFNADQNLSTPWENHDKLWWHSPVKYADKVTTPTLFIHSQEDYRCWLAEGLQMFTALKYHGVEARLCMFRGENHELSRSGKPKHRVRRLEEMTNWFEQHLK